MIQILKVKIADTFHLVTLNLSNNNNNNSSNNSMNKTIKVVFNNLITYLTRLLIYINLFNGYQMIKLFRIKYKYRTFNNWNKH
jgi:hypothetical protein